MSLSEIFIIYLAAAAPFGVARFLSEHNGRAGAGAALLRAAGAALAWPFTSLPRLLKRAASWAGAGNGSLEAEVPDGQRVEQLKRAAVNGLRELEDLLDGTRPVKGEAGRHAFFAAREGVERYAGLALACASASADARPSSREMELCRIAGRGGDDLLVAGRCVHRRNVTRLVAHRERAGSELFQALAAVRDLSAAGAAEQLRDGDPERISAALRLALTRVVELLSLYDDRATADGVARLLGAGARPCAVEGEEPCTTRAAHTAFAERHLRTTTSHGG